MTREQKEAFYGLLKASSAYYRGYTATRFAEAAPAFEDDGAPAAPQAAPTAAPSRAAPRTASSLSFRLSAGSGEPGIPRAEERALEAAPEPEPAAAPPAAGGAPALTLENIAQKVFVCRACVLSRTRRNVVIGEGVRDPVVLVVGEGPGEEEDRTGRPFVGPAGVLLDKMLKAISLSRTTNCYIANIVKCRPPMNRAPMADEVSACIPFLQGQIHVLRPRFILAMGRTAVQALLNTASGINALRGKWFEYGAGSETIPLLATYHPSALLRDVNLKRPAWEDLKVFRARLKTEVPRYAQKFYEESALH